MPVRIAVASGKGGTGKTTFATNLAVALGRAGIATAYADCDVEEPNGHLFLAPSIRQQREVSIPVPRVDASRCNLCGACGKSCRYPAIAVMPQQVLTFPKLCHGCGGCALACPRDAISQVERVTGVVQEGTAGRLAFLQGRLNVGEAMAPPVIRAVLSSVPADRVVVIDAPPGTSCPVVASVASADVVLLVTEPTPFGLHDLELAVELVRALGLPLGVAVNRAGTGDSGVQDYCAAQQIPVLMSLATDRGIAAAYARGELAIHARPDLEPRLLGLFQALEGLARTGRRQPPAHAPAPEEIRPLAPVPSQCLRVGNASRMRELVVVSGKGGTGKTSIVASFSALASNAALADCDVDAADLHLVLGPSIKQRWPFSGGHTAVIDAHKCAGCGTCASLCRFDAIRPGANPSTHVVVPTSCEGCGVCVDACPQHAVSLVPSPGGEWFVSQSRHGPMVHARLGIGQENSGKLVSLVRNEAKAVAASNRCALLLSDGPPGIGCPVIAAVSGAHMVLLVSEPTLSGLHDLARVAELCQQFKVKTGLCVNKADLNPDITSLVEEEAARRGIVLLGRIRYDESVTAAQVDKVSVVEHGDGPAAQDIRLLWDKVLHELT